MKTVRSIIAVIVAAAILLPCMVFCAEGASAVKATLGVKETYTLPAAVKADCSITSPDVITVVKRTVTAKKIGVTTLRYTGADGKQYSFLFAVKKAPAAIVVPKTKTVYDNQVFSVKYKLTKDSAGKVTFYTSNNRVAAVNKNGTIFAKHSGVVTVTAKTYNGKKASCKVTVKQRAAVMRMSRERIALPKTATAKLSAAVNSGAYAKYKWTSSNNSVVSVKGKGLSATITSGRKAGKAVITCTANSGAKATCTVVVTKSYATESMKKQINAQPLYKETTGYAPLDRLVQRTLAKILKGKATTYDKVKAIYDYEIRTFTYGRSHTLSTADIFLMYPSSKDASLVEMAYETLTTHRGVCDNYAAVFTVLTRAIGLDSYSVGGTTGAAAGGFTGHAWNNIIINNRYVVFDAQVEDDISRGGSIGYYRFAKTDSEVRSSYRYQNRDSEVKSFNHFRRYPDFVIQVTLTRNGTTVSKTFSWKKDGTDFINFKLIKMKTGASAGKIAYTIKVLKGSGMYYLQQNEAYFNGKSPYLINTFSGVLPDTWIQSLAIVDYLYGTGFEIDIS